MLEIKNEYTLDEIATFYNEHIRYKQRTTSYNVKVLFAVHNSLFPNQKEFTTSCPSCVQKVKNKIKIYLDEK